MCTSTGSLRASYVGAVPGRLVIEGVSVNAEWRSVLEWLRLPLGQCDDTVMLGCGVVVAF